MEERDALTAGDDAYDRVQQLLQSISENSHVAAAAEPAPRLAWPGLAAGADRGGRFGGGGGGGSGRRRDEGMDDVEGALGTHSVLQQFEPSMVPRESLHPDAYDDQLMTLDNEEKGSEAVRYHNQAALGYSQADPASDTSADEGVDLSATLQSLPEGKTDPPLGLEARTQIEVALHSGKDEHVVLTEFLRAASKAENEPMDADVSMIGQDDLQGNRAFGYRQTLLQNHLYWLGHARKLGVSAMDNSHSVRSTFDGQKRLDREKLMLQLQERDTWLLMYMLSSGMVPSVPPDESDDADPFNTFQQEVDLVYADDVKLQRWDVVCRWLQIVSGADFQFTDRRGAKRGKYRPNTVHALKTPSNLTKHGDDPVDRADPDADLRGPVASARGGAFKKLQADDEDDQVLLLEQLWKLVRSGAFYTSSKSTGERLDAFQFNERETALEDLVKQTCLEYGEPFRVASLMGGAIVTPTQGKSDADPLRLAGNPFRTTWKETCVNLAAQMHQVAESTTGPQRQAALLEEAIYAILGGDMEAALKSPHCSSWRDWCWAAFRCMVEAKVDHVCIDYHERLEASIGHMRGPDMSGSPGQVLSRGAASVELSETTLFDQVAQTVPDEESFFFKVQRALIEGNFNSLLMDPRDEGDLCLCEYLCGSQWTEAAFYFTEEIAGTSALVTRAARLARRDAAFYLETLDAHDDDEEVATTIDLVARVQEAACWKYEHRPTAVQMLRFTTHAALFMRYSKSNLRVVEEAQELAAKVPEALALAYIRFLVRDANNSLDRFASIPSFYPCFVSDPGQLNVTVHAAVMEAAASFSAGDRVSLFRAWTSIVSPSYMLARAARQALRNVRMRWHAGVSSPDYIREATERTERGASDSIENDASETSATDPRIRICQTWYWLAMDPTSRGEAFVQANAIIRDLIFAWASSDKGDAEDIEIARSFLEENVDPLLPSELANTAAFRDDVIVDEEALALTMSPIAADVVETERMHLRAFLEVAVKIWEWKHGMAQIDGPVDPIVSSEILARASEIADLIENLLSSRHGWLHPEMNSSERPEWPADGERVAEVDEEPETMAELDLRAYLYGSSRDDAGAMRARIIPWLIETYMSVCTAASDYAEDHEFFTRQVAVVNIVANPKLRIQQCFEKSSMRHFLERVRKAANEIVHFQRAR
ncbi:Nuclear pore complex protein Nup107 [Hondaea fermentalgiana]|uniref:Nuclear pore complex protein n=1 Tax=Hondaea fermentalgiana TaxID=2315210 RepID=A0A2R5GFB6_9STRA|nr:Nuclear pore complex protein Nup107 [Hondaea fermentalgiana]|eukprot:GBG29622.1 Nuclear pore complex protein Nup107 [Hondaea fermentalgiana]